MSGSPKGAPFRSLAGAGPVLFEAFYIGIGLLIVALGGLIQVLD